MTKNKKIYVAGHRGLVGSAIVRCLQKAGYENLLLRTHSELDLTGKGAVDEFFATQRPDYVFLAAAKVGGIHANDTYPADFIYDNLTIQNNVLHAAFEYKVEKLIFLGSSCIYPRLAPQPMREEYLLSGSLEPTNSAYAVAKIAGIEMCHAFNRQYQTNFVSVMPTNLYGPQDNYDLMNSHAMPAMIRKFHLAKLAAAGDNRALAADTRVYGLIPDDFYSNLMQIAAFYGHTLNGTGAAGKPLLEQKDASMAVDLWGTGTPKREFLYVDDLADALIFIMFHSQSLQVLNIGTGVDQTIRELAEIVRGVVGYPGGISFDATKPDGMPRKLLDISRLADLGWKPKFTLKDGIKQAYTSYLEGLD
ncbi:MAG: GDP-L-fucose synthase [Deltaproteobacteria bacterium]|nr:GDP-L-fucose synthase [Deltaproteobacteria bacterium]